MEETKQPPHTPETAAVVSAEHIFVRQVSSDRRRRRRRMERMNRNEQNVIAEVKELDNQEEYVPERSPSLEYAPETDLDCADSSPLISKSGAITIKVKRMGGGAALGGTDGTCLTLTDVHPQTTVADLKRRIYEELWEATRGVAAATEVAVPVERQRLIYSGRMLTVDGDRLGVEVKMKPGSVVFVHLVPIPEGKKPSVRKRGENKGRLPARGATSPVRRQIQRVRRARTAPSHRSPPRAGVSLCATHPYRPNISAFGGFGSSPHDGVGMAPVVHRNTYNTAGGIYSMDPPPPPAAAAQQRQLQDEQTVASGGVTLRDMAGIGPLATFVGSSEATSQSLGASAAAFSGVPSVGADFLFGGCGTAGASPRALAHGYALIPPVQPVAVSNVPGRGVASGGSAAESAVPASAAENSTAMALANISRLAQELLPEFHDVHSRLGHVCGLLDNEAERVGKKAEVLYASRTTEQRSEMVQDIDALADRLERFSRASGNLVGLLRSVDLGPVPGEDGVGHANPPRGGLPRAVPNSWEPSSPQQRDLARPLGGSATLATTVTHAARPPSCDEDRYQYFPAHSSRVAMSVPTHTHAVVVNGAADEIDAYLRSAGDRTQANAPQSRGYPMNQHTPAYSQLQGLEAVPSAFPTAYLAARQGNMSAAAINPYGL